MSKNRIFVNYSPYIVGAVWTVKRDDRPPRQDAEEAEVATHGADFILTLRDDGRSWWTPLYRLTADEIESAMSRLALEREHEINAAKVDAEREVVVSV